MSDPLEEIEIWLTGLRFWYLYGSKIMYIEWSCFALFFGP